VIASDVRLKQNATILRDAGVKRALVFQGKKRFGFDEELQFDGDFDALDSVSTESGLMTDDTSHIIYTSGSTGLPKGIVISHRNTIDGAKIVSGYTGLKPDDRMMAALPFNFDYGFNQLMNAVYIGATLVLHTFFMPQDLLRVLEEQEITVFAGMTPIWTKIFNPKLTDLSKDYDFSRVRVLTNTGGKVPIPIVRKMRSLFAEAEIYLMYGLTEAFRSTFLDPREIDRRPGSIGKAVPNVEILVLDKDGRACGPDQEGELVHRGALISKGYWNSPEKTAEVFRPNPLLGEENAHLETVVFSGDIVKKDEEGFLYYVGRKDEMIKTKGYRVSPTEVEELISHLEGVHDCIATGFEQEDEILLRVFVTLNKETASRDAVMTACKQQFPFYLVPDDIVVRDGFPLTANGKIDRNRVIEEFHDAKK
jgi:acyl-CoA synthetase (AMP-forming)/AMP-acid ligase II